MPDGVWQALGSAIEGEDPWLLKVVFVLLGYAMLFQLAALVLDWLWRKVRPRKKPAPKKVHPASLPTLRRKRYPLRYRMDKLDLSWEFDSDLERQAFLTGLREGSEYRVEALKQSGKLSQSIVVEHGKVDARAKERDEIYRYLPKKPPPP